MKIKNKPMNFKSSIINKNPKHNLHFSLSTKHLLTSQVINPAHVVLLDESDNIYTFFVVNHIITVSSLLTFNLIIPKFIDFS